MHCWGRLVHHRPAGDLLKRAAVTQADTSPPAPSSHLSFSFLCGCSAAVLSVTLRLFLWARCFLWWLQPLAHHGLDLFFPTLTARVVFHSLLPGQHRQFDFVLLLKQLCGAAWCDRQGNDATSELGFNQAPKICWFWRPFFVPCWFSLCSAVGRGLGVIICLFYASSTVQPLELPLHGKRCVPLSVTGWHNKWVQGVDN